MAPAALVTTGVVQVTDTCGAIYRTGLKWRHNCVGVTIVSNTLCLKIHHREFACPSQTKCSLTSNQARGPLGPKGLATGQWAYSLNTVKSIFKALHENSGGMIAPGFESHQCLAGMWKRRLSCHAGRQEVSRCCTRGESQGTCNVTRMPPLSSNKAEPTLALKPRGDVTRSPE